jgi:protein-S-isoprenylcysteine O-methyltransferase Ste14
MHWVGFLIPLMLLAMFMFFNVPKLDDYLRERYGASFVAYEGKTKRLIPFVW